MKWVVLVQKLNPSYASCFFLFWRQHSVLVTRPLSLLCNRVQPIVKLSIEVLWTIMKHSKLNFNFQPKKLIPQKSFDLTLHDLIMKEQQSSDSIFYFKNHPNHSENSIRGSTFINDIFWLLQVSKSFSKIGSYFCWLICKSTQVQYKNP